MKRFPVTAYIASTLFPVVCTIKAEAHVWGGDTLVYAGDAVFRKGGGVVKVEGIAAPGGRIVGAAEVGGTGNGQRALCYITDHLGSNRYRYNGKEEQALAAGVPYTDYGARFFDPEHCTWLSPDPLSGKYPCVYPYAFCAGDPVNYVDPDGRELSDFYTLNGSFFVHIDDDSDKKFFILSLNNNIRTQKIENDPVI